MSDTIAELNVKLALDAGKFQSGLSQSANEAQSWSGKMGGFWSNAFSYVTGGLIQTAIHGVTSARGDLYEGLIGGPAQFEQYNVQFGKLIENSADFKAAHKDVIDPLQLQALAADEAKDHMQALADFGASTPFELPQVVDASKVLKGFGLDSQQAAQDFGYSGQEILTIAGDVASGTGADFQEMALNIGKFSKGATGESIARFMELGILTRDEMAAMGLEFSKSGQLLSPLPEATNVMLTLMKEKYGGMMDAQSKTFGGMVSNLEDWKAGTLRTIGQPIFEVLRDKLGGLLTFLNSPATMGAISSFATNLATGIGSTMEFVGGAVSAFTTGLENGFLGGISNLLFSLGGISPVFVSIGEAVAGFGGQLDTIAPLFAPLLEQITGFAGAVVGVFNDNGPTAALRMVINTLAEISPGFAMLKAAVEAALPPIQSIITSVFGIVAGFLQQNGASIVAFAQTTWSQIQGIVNSVLPPIQAIVATVFGAIATFLQQHGGEIQATLTTVWQTIQVVISGVVTVVRDVIVPIFTAIAGFISQHSAEIQGILSGAWHIIQGVVEVATSVIQGIIKTVVALIHGDWSGAWTAIKDMFSGVWDGIKTILSGAVEVIKNTLSVAWDVIKAGVGVAWEGVKSTVSGAIDGIKNLISGIVSVGSDMVNGLVTGVQQAAGRLLDAAIGVVKGAIDGAKEWLGIASPSRLARDVIGVQITAGIAEGVLAGGKDLVDGATGLMDRTIGAMQGRLTSGAGQLTSGMRDLLTQVSPSGLAGFAAANLNPSGLANVRPGGAGGGAGGASITYNTTANYSHQPERTLSQDLRMQQMLGAAL